MAQTNDKIRILLTGGGTGGHVFPAIAIADAIKSICPHSEFLFVGAEGKMEMERVPKAGYRITGLPVTGFQRRFSIENLVKNALFPFKLMKSMAKAREIIHDYKPNVVVGTGGYASGPIVKSAQRAGIPTVIQEQNSYAGVTNKLLGGNADQICVAFDGMDAFFPKEKITLTGNPVRTDILDLEGKREEALRHFGLKPNRKTILVIGGSLGAGTLNKAMVRYTDLIKNTPEIQLLWQCGKNYLDEYQQSELAQLEQVKLLAFLDKMDLAYAAADIVISRAGALSVSELCLVGKPAILVPSPNVAEDHQTKNAEALSNIGAARLIKDADAIEKTIPEALQILNNEALAFSLSEHIRPLGRPQAAHTIARIILNLSDKTS